MAQVTMNVRVWHDELQVTAKLVTEVCCSCGVVFAWPEELYRQAKGDPETWFYCPNGHRQHYTVDEAAQLRRQLTARQAELDRAVADARYQAGQARLHKRQAAAYKGQLTRARKRLGAGVCPVTDCRRTVRQLADHMASRHPDYASSPVTEDG
jgi:hypothetical protein